MRKRLALVLACVAGPAVGAPMEDACLARGTWDADTCACMQGVADRTLEPETQDTAAAFFARQITSQQIAAEKGPAAAQEFLAALASFMTESTAECGAP